MLKRGFKVLLAEANAVIESVAVLDLPYHLEDEDVVLLDVRESEERKKEGEIPGSIHVPRGLRLYPGQVPGGRDFRSIPTRALGGHSLFL